MIFRARLGCYVKGEEGSSIHSVAVAIYPLPPVVLLEVGAERIGDTVEQIRLKYVPSGPNRATPAIVRQCGTNTVFEKEPQLEKSN